MMKYTDVERIYFSNPDACPVSVDTPWRAHRSMHLLVVLAPQYPVPVPTGSRGAECVGARCGTPGRFFRGQREAPSQWPPATI
jgi:hypothetical protein